MATRLTNEDVDFLTELVEQEIQRVVARELESMKTAIAQTFVDLAARQLEYFGFTFGEAATDNAVGTITGPLPMNGQGK